MARDIAAGDVRPAHLRRRLARKRATPQDWPDAPTTAGARPSRTEPPVTERPTPDLDDHRDPRLPRPERLVLRPGDPPGRRPRRARGLPHRHAARLHRAPARRAARPRTTTPARAAAGAASSSGCTRAPGSGHVTEHVALAAAAGRSATTSAAARPGGVKGEPGRYNVIYGYVDENVGLAAGRLAVRLVNHLVQADPEFDFDAELETFILRAERTAFGPSTQAILDEAVTPRHPVDPAQPALAGPARPGRPPASGSAPR